MNSQGVLEAKGNLDAFANTAKKMEQAASSAEKKVGSLDEAFSSLSPSALASVAGVTALIGSIKGLLGIGKSIISISSGFEQVETGLKTVTGSSEKASEVFEQLRKLSYDTTFGMQELGNAATTLLNAGQTTGTINDTLVMLGNLATGDKQKFIELSNIYSKIQMLGKAGSEQLEMITMRGIPIKQTLKDIGVTGTATAADITKAFQELTKEGGAFAGAMNNLNDTISGKESFVTDTLAEIAVNFGELTGITDTYKAVLDVVKNALDAVNNALMSMNGNPFIKVLVSGALAAALTALVAIVGGALLIALKQVIVHLTAIAALKAVINPATIGIAAVVGGLTGVGLALANIKSKADEAAEAIQNIKPPQTGSEWIDKNIDDYSKKIETLEKRRDKIEKAYNKSLNKLGISSFDDFKKDTSTNVFKKEFKTLEEAYSAFQEKTIANADPRLKKQLEYYQEQLALSEAQLEIERQLRTETDDYTNALSNARDIVTNIESSNEKQLKAYQEQIKTIEQLKNANQKGWESRDDNGNRITLHLDDDVAAGLDKAGDNLKRKLEDLKIKIAIENASDWQKELQKSLGLTDKEAVTKDGKMKSGLQMVDTFNDLWKSQLSVGLGATSESTQLDYLSKIPDVLESLKDANLHLSDNEKFKLGDKSIDTLLETAQIQFSKIAKPLLDSGVNVSAGKDAAGNDLTSTQIDKVNALNEAYQSLTDVLGETNPTVQKMKESIESLTAKTDEAIPEISQDKTSRAVSLDSSFFQNTVSSNLMKVGTGETSLSNGLGGIVDDLAGSFGSLSGIIQIVIQLVGSLISEINNIAQNAEGGEEAFSPFKGFVESIGNVIESFIGQVAQSVDIFTDILSPLTLIFQLLNVLATLGRPFLSILQVIVKILTGPIRTVIGYIEKFADWLDGIFDSFDEWLGLSNEKNEEEQEELERLKALNEQYKSLKEAIEEQEEYYLQKRREVNAQTYKDELVGNDYSTSVNDMILTPHGKFSTHPDDTIIAMKHPEELGASGSATVRMSVVVNNNASDVVQVTPTQTTDDEGNEELFIQISRIVASDYANGTNGWDGAVSYREQRTSGRRVTT